MNQGRHGDVQLEFTEPGGYVLAASAADLNSVSRLTHTLYIQSTQ